MLVDLLGEEFNGVLGCDYFSAYRKYMADFDVLVQFCLAHLIRDVKFLTEQSDRVTANYVGMIAEAVQQIACLALPAAAVPIPHEVAEVFTDGIAMAEIVLVSEKAVEPPQILRAGRDDSQCQRLQVAQRAANRLGGMLHVGHVPIAPPVGRGAAPRGQANVAGPLQLQ